METSENRENERRYDLDRQTSEWDNRHTADATLMSPPPPYSVVMAESQFAFQATAMIYQPKEQSHQQQQEQQRHQLQHQSQQQQQYQQLQQQQQRYHRLQQPQPQQHQPQQPMPFTIAGSDFGANAPVPHEMAPARMSLAILATMCCYLGLPCGLIALAYSCSVKDARKTGNLQLAVKYSEDAKFWIACSGIAGAISYLFTIVYRLFYGGLPCLDHPCSDIKNLFSSEHLYS